MKFKKHNRILAPDRKLEEIVIPRRTFLKGALAGAGALALPLLTNCSEPSNHNNNTNTGTGTGTSGTNSKTRIQHKKTSSHLRHWCKTILQKDWIQTRWCLC